MAIGNVRGLPISNAALFALRTSVIDTRQFCNNMGGFSIKDLNSGVLKGMQIGFIAQSSVNLSGVVWCRDKNLTCTIFFNAKITSLFSWNMNLVLQIIVDNNAQTGIDEASISFDHKLLDYSFGSKVISLWTSWSKFLQKLFVLHISKGKNLWTSFRLWVLN